MKKYLVLVLVLCFSSIAWAGGGNFDASVDNDWWESGNWTGGGAPAGDGENGWICADAVVGSGTAAFGWAYVGWTEDGSVTIEAGASFNVYSARMGNVGGGGFKDGTMIVEGYFSAWGDTVIGDFANGSMIINGNGVVNNAAVNTYMGCNDGSTGYLELNDNASMSTAWLIMDGYYWSGDPNSTKVQLNGGTLTISGLNMYGSNGDWNGAVIDFDGGTLLIAGNYVDTAYYLESDGRFTSSNGIVATYSAGLNQTFISEMVTGPDCDGLPLGDLDGNCKVDMADIAILADHWYEDAGSICMCFPVGDLSENCIVDLADLGIIAITWLEDTSLP
jgi:hypothetical protein